MGSAGLGEPRVGHTHTPKHVLKLTHSYGVRRILGFRYGYLGLSSASTSQPVELRPETVESIHQHGGTLEIRNNPGEGSTIKVTLPLLEESEGTDDGQQA